MTHALGSFDVKLTAQETADPAVGRMSIDKQYHGDLDAAGKGEMLSAMTEVKASAGYVAIEHVTGSLNGRPGSFMLQHSGVMDRGTARLSVTVVPDSGTGQLAGLTGKMNIIINAGNHSYEFEYTLPEQ